MTPDFWPRACRELSSRDEVLRKLIKTYKGEILRSRGNAFETLFRSIVGQQISVKAAQSVWDRVTQLIKVISPDCVLAERDENLRACGLSARKVEYAKDLARHFTSKSVDPSLWPQMTDESVIEQLVLVRGIGQWTAEMFLISHLLRPNVFPEDDLGLQKALALSYGKRYPLSSRQMKLFRKQFHPWASVATWYFWRSLDPIPVEY